MNELATATHLDDGVATEICTACQHPMALHDRHSTRWCAATRLGLGGRQCICAGVVAGARNLSHY